jgi:hypothetical protein
MDLFETITAHQGAMRLPLYAVTMTAAARVDTPFFLMLHWHGFRRETPVRVPGVAVPARPVAGSAVQIDDHWDSVAALDQAMLEAAWRMGAWEVERATHRPWWRLGAPAGEALACHRAFGDYPDAEDGPETVIADTPDRRAMMDMAARRGYIRWMFRPRKAGLWAQLDDEDSTVDASGGRALPCPVAPRPWDGGLGSRFVYRLGQVQRLIVPNTH